MRIRAFPAGDATASPQRGMREGLELSGLLGGEADGEEPLTRPKESGVVAVQSARGGNTLLESGWTCWTKKLWWESLCVCECECDCSDVCDWM